MKYLIAFLCVLGMATAQVVPGAGLAAGPTSAIVGQIQTSTGGVITNGTLTFNLSQAAIVPNSAAIVTMQTSCYTSSPGNIVGVPDPVVLPITSVNISSGTLPAGTYYVEIYYIGAGGVSAISPEAQVSLSSQGTIIVNPPVLQPASATGYGIAIGTTSGGETVQGTLVGWTQFSQATPLITGSAFPAVNTSACLLYFSDELIPTGTHYRVTLLNKNGSLIPGYPQTWCTYGGAGGTINVSQGAPTGNCNTNAVFYPTPIFAHPISGLSQSISGPINFTGNVNFSLATFAGSQVFNGGVTFNNTTAFNGSSAFTQPVTYSAAISGTSAVFSSGITTPLISAPAATSLVVTQPSGATSPMSFTTGSIGLGGTTQGFNFQTGAVTSGGGTSGGFGFFVGVAATRGTLSTNTLFSQYGQGFTVRNGFPTDYAAVDLTAQTAAITGPVTLFSVPFSNPGQYWLSWNAKVTTPAGSSSTLGPLTIVYTDPDGTVQTITAGALTAAGAIATTSTGNSTTAVLLGLPLLLNCGAGTTVTYAFGYASNAANVMNYNLHITLQQQ